MGQRPKAKPKRKNRKNTDKEQSERFIETARILGLDNGDRPFEDAIKKIVAVKRPAKK